jgi:hypothetical protein
MIMGETPGGRRKTGLANAQGRAAPAATHAGRIRALLAGNVAGILVSPVIGIYVGFLLLFGGIFLAAAWQAGPEPLLDAAHYATFTASTTGRIVESWVALEFNPDDVRPNKNWHGQARLRACTIVEYKGDWSAPLRRAFCGGRFEIHDDLDLNQWNTLESGIPLGWQRDASGFALLEFRLTKPALDWLGANPPYDTFTLRKPPPTTALTELTDESDHPVAVAQSSWLTPLPPFPLAYDPQHPDAPMPAKYVEDRRQGGWLGGLVFTAILGVMGLLVWRLGLSVFFSGNQSPAVIWLLTIAPLLALPWWGDVLPKILRHLNSNWADVGSIMLDSMSQTTRMIGSEPSAAVLAGGERLVLHLDQGEYADTFGRIHFVLPDPPPKSPGLALAALAAQASAQVRAFAPAQQAALFARLEQDKQADLDAAQYAFTTAAEDILRDAGSDAAVRRAARHFLLFSAGYMLWDVEALEKPQPTPSADPK